MQNSGCQAVEQTATEIAIVTAVWRNLTASEKSKLQSNGVEPLAVPATVTATATAPPAGQYCGCARVGVVAGVVCFHNPQQQLPPVAVARNFNL